MTQLGIPEKLGYIKAKNREKAGGDVDNKEPYE